MIAHGRRVEAVPRLRDRVRGHASTLRRSHGAFLLEAIVAALIFAFGALGLAALQGRAVRHLQDAEQRGEAARLADAAIAAMRLDDPAQLFARYDATAGGPGYLDFARRAQRLPGVDATALQPELSVADGPSARSRRVALRVFWRLPGDAAVHRHAIETVIGGNR